MHTILHERFWYVNQGHSEILSMLVSGATFFLRGLQACVCVAINQGALEQQTECRTRARASEGDSELECQESVVVAETLRQTHGTTIYAQ